MAETEISEIESLVSVISSEEVRNETRLKLYIELVNEKKGNVKLPEPYVDETINYCEKKFDETEISDGGTTPTYFLIYAARIAKHAGRTEQARQLYEKAVNFEDEHGYDHAAAVLAREAGMKTKARELYGKILLSYEEIRDFVNAAQIAEEAGMPEKAKEYRVLEEKLKKLPPHFRY